MPDVIVLLTDGANNRGITPAPGRALRRRPAGPHLYDRLRHDPPGTAHVHAPAGRLHSAAASAAAASAAAVGGMAAEGSAAAVFPLVADLPPLREVSRLTGATSYSAQDASQLSKVFANLPKHVTVQKERHEVTASFAVIGALLALAFGASIRWSPSP